MGMYRISTGRQKRRSNSSDPASAPNFLGVTSRSVEEKKKSLCFLFFFFLSLLFSFSSLLWGKERVFVF